MAVTSKQIIDYARRLYNDTSEITPEQLSKTVGALNGVDMKTYFKGYTDALRQLIVFFETRLTDQD